MLHKGKGKVVPVL